MADGPGDKIGWQCSLTFSTLISKYRILQSKAE